MIFQHTIEQVLDGTKTQTRRIAKGLVSRCKYSVGKTYAVQPGRGKKGVARIRIIGMHNEHLQELTEEDAVAEGCKSTYDLGGIRGGYCRTISAVGNFAKLWDSIQPPGRRWADNPMVWVIKFELVND